MNERQSRDANRGTTNAGSVRTNFCVSGGDMTANERFRRILVSVKFVSAILGPEMAAPILWTPGKNASVLQENHVHKILRFRGGGDFGFWGGGGVPILFLWARGLF